MTIGLIIAIILGLLIIAIAIYLIIAYQYKIWPFKKNITEVITPQPEPVPEPQPAPITFTEKDNLTLVSDVMHKAIPADYPIKKYGKRATRDECEKECRVDQDCLGYTWTYPPQNPGWQGYCYGKLSGTPENAERLLPNYFSGVKQ